MKVSTRGDYAARALLSLALHDDHEGPTSVRDIAERTGLPQPYLEQILLALKGAGLVRSKRGVGGGYVLARDPSKISIVDVMEAIDGPIGMTPCERGSSCEQMDRCSVRDPLMKLKVKVVRVLGDTSIYELAMN